MHKVNTGQTEAITVPPWKSLNHPNDVMFAFAGLILLSTLKTLKCTTVVHKLNKINTEKHSAKIT